MLRDMKNREVLYVALRFYITKLMRPISIKVLSFCPGFVLIKHHSRHRHQYFLCFCTHKEAHDILFLVSLQAAAFYHYKQGRVFAACSSPGNAIHKD